MTNKDINYTVTADDGPFAEGMKRVQAALKQTDGQITGLFSGMSSPFGKVMGMLGVVSTVLAGGAIFKASVEASKDFTLEATKLSKALGINATEASTLNVALGDIYSDAETFTGAATKLAKELRTNEDGLRAMGLQTRDASGNLRGMKDLMVDSLTIINSYKEGTDRTIAAQKFFGKGAADTTALLKLNNDVLAEAAKKQQELGLIVGVENVEATKAYRAAMNDVDDVILAVKKAIGDALMPVLTQLGNFFASVGPAAVTIIKGAIGGLVAVFWGLYNAVNIVWEILDSMIYSVAEPLKSLGTALFRLVQGDFKGAAETMMSWPDRIAQRWKDAGASMVESSVKAREALYNLFAEPTAAAAPKGGGKTIAEDPNTKKSLMARFEAELNAQKQAHAAQNAANDEFYEFGEQRELEFWKAKSALVLKGSQDAYAIQGKITQATLAIQKEAFEQRLASLKREQDAAEQNFAARSELAQRELALVRQRFGDESKQAEDAQRKVQEIDRAAREQRRQLREAELAELQLAADSAIELARQHAQLQLDIGVINKQQMLQLERQFEASRYQIAAQAAEERLTLVDPTLNPVEYARIKAEIEQIEQQHRQRLGQINAASTVEQTRDWTSMFGTMQSGFASVIQGFLNRTKTLAETVRGLFAAIGNAIIGTLAQMAARWLIEQITQRVIGKITAASQIGANAAVAGSAAFAATAAIPFVGPALAPGAAAAAYAGALSFMAAIPAAERGYDIPAGINPLTQLHEREMVLPQEQADAVRDMAAGRSSGGAPVELRGVSAGEFFIASRKELLAVLKGARRDFAF
ncbi:hypothetical protein [Methylibium sp.]|uniref:hypothetical protein n=1 Tax=Methylibium sp. TaxID=2067992 RepID=UPI003D0AF307